MSKTTEFIINNPGKNFDGTAVNETKVIECHHVPALAYSFQAKYAGLSLIELINRHDWVVTYHITNHNWSLSEDAKMDLKEKMKKGSKGYSGGHHRPLSRLF